MAAAWCLLTAAAAQTADSSKGQAPAGPGAPGAWQCLAARRGELESELTALLAAQQPVDVVEDLILRARINTRRIAMSLLAKASIESPGQARIAVMALRFSGGLPAIDETLPRALDGERTSPAAARDSLARFNDVVVAQVEALEPSDAVAFALRLSEALAPLGRVIGLSGPGPAPSPWIETPAADPSAAALTIEQRLTAFGERIDHAISTELIRAAMQASLDYLQRGLAFEELRPHVERYFDALRRLVAAWESLQGATVLTVEDRDAYDRRVRHAAEDFLDPERRERALRQIDRLEASAIVCRGLAALDDDPPAQRDVQAILRAAEFAFDDENTPTDGRAALMRIDGLVTVMAAYRRLDIEVNTRELRQTRKALQDSYERAESSVLDLVRPQRAPGAPGVPGAPGEDVAAASPRRWSDPAVTGGLQHMRNSIADLERLGRMDGWIDAIERMRPRAVRLTLRRLRIVAGWLTEPGRRDDAAGRLERFEACVKRFERLPLEGELRRSIELAALTGGLHEALEVAIESARTRWVETLATDLTGGAGARDMDRLHQLMSAMAAFIGLADVDEDLRLLNRWAAWWLDPATLRRPMSELPQRFKLAVAALINGAENDFAAQLDVIERDLPLPVLVGRLAHAGRAALESLPASEAASSLGGLLVMPPERAWLIDERDAIALLCLCAREREQLRAAPGTSPGIGAPGRDAEAIDDLVLDLARRIESLVEPASRPVSTP